MSRIDSLKIFVEVVTCRNFTTAAKKLGLTPSAVSKQIGFLEERLSVRLLNRTTRTVSTTEAGQLYFERCRRILEDLQDADALVLDMDATPRGTLKLAVEPVFGRTILARIISDFTEKHPEVNAEIFLTEHCLAMVKQGYDAGIHLGKLDDPALQTANFASHHVILCASPQYTEKYGVPGSVAELATHKLIKISSMEFQQSKQLDDYFENLGLSGPFNLMVNDTDMAFSAAMAGLGIAPLPNYLVMPQVRANRLTQILPAVSTQAHPVQLVYPATRYVPQKTLTFIHFLSEYFPANRAQRTL